MVLHLEEHVLAGDKVPKRAFTRLRKEARERKTHAVVYPIHLAVHKTRGISWRSPLCGYDFQAHSGFTKPKGHAHPRDESTSNPRRVTCRWCKKLMKKEPRRG